ncbi:MAG: ABC transporter ATP-binding protein [Clostridia bacterium]|nr:ABC transporter ATP-binding protein [Clostridia bacterium]
MIQVSHLTKYYGPNRALDDVSFSIGEGEVVGLLGPNGAGKSTAMNILTGCLCATSGEVTVDGLSLSDDPTEVKRRIGYLPEVPPLYPDMTVIEFLRFVYELKRCRFDREAHLREICDLLRITDVRHRLVGHLSKGYRQRVGVAQALVGDPRLIILDEPTAGLDPKQIIEVRQLIRTLARRHTVLLSTHILGEVTAVCGRVLIINRGKVIADRPTDALDRLVEDSLRYRYAVVGPEKDVTALLSAVPEVARVTPTGESDGEASVYVVSGRGGVDCRKAVYYACAKAGRPILSAAPLGGDLESVFVQLVDRDDEQA